MKILLSRLSFGEIGGAELSARDITKSLIRLGHQPLFATNLTDSQVVGEIPRGFIRKSPRPLNASAALDKVLYPFRFTYSLLWYFVTTIRFRPDIIHPHSRQDQLFLTIVGLVLKIPVIWRDPGDLYPQLTHDVSGTFQKVNRRMQLWAIKHAGHIITLNDDEMHHIVEMVPELSRDNISAIGSDIMFDNYTPRKHTADEADLTIGTASRLDEHKGIQHAIAAFKEVLKNHGNMNLVIAGKGAYEDTLKELAKDTVQIEFTGHQSNMSDFYNRLDIFIQPALFEGWGRNIKEAKLFSLPIVGSQVGGIQAQLVDGVDGLLFSPGDVDELATKLESLITNHTEREKIGARARKNALAEGDWVAKVEKQYIPLFERFLDEKNTI